MRLISLRTGVPILLAFVMSCKSTGRPTDAEVKGEVSGTADNVPSSLGKGFDSETQTIKGKCVEGKPVWAGAQEASLNYEQDMDFDSMLKTFSGGANVGVKLSIFDVKGAADFASKQAADNFSSTISIINKVTIKKKVLDDLHILASMKPIIVKDGKVIDNVRDYCGDEFFATVIYGAELFVNAKFSFQTREDKLEFKGSANVSLAAIGELGGQISHLSDNLKKNSKVSITARQVGGDTDKLSSILSAEVITCSLAEFEAKCLPILTKIVNYAKDEENGFRGGLKAIPDPEAKETAKGWAQTRFISNRYENEPIDGLFLESPLKKTILNAAIKDARDEVYDAFEVQLQDGERATNLLRNFNLSADQIQSLTDIQKATTTNKTSLLELADTCLRRPNECIPGLARYRDRAKAYDPNKLVLNVCFNQKDLENTTWAVKRSDGEPFGDVTLKPNGEHNFLKGFLGTKWEVQNCYVRFLSFDKSPIMVYDIIESNDTMTGVLPSALGKRFILTRKK